MNRTEPKSLIPFDSDGEFVFLGRRTGLDLNIPGAHDGLRPDQVDIEQTVLQRRARDLYPFRDQKSSLKLAGGDTAVQELPWRALSKLNTTPFPSSALPPITDQSRADPLPEPLP